ncbi:MAG: DUF5652 family protein [Gammaproteobacteria bacterium]|nr:DUF5652 family protein [Gammaproteobacteria bacterium]
MMLEPPLLYYWVIPLIIWSACWKLVALWKAARNRQLAWFIVLAIFNTAGMLPILYIYFYQRDKSEF